MFVVYIQAPQHLDLTNCNLLKAMQAALKLEETVYDNLLKLHDTAENDPEVLNLTIVDNLTAGGVIILLNFFILVSRFH